IGGLDHHPVLAVAALRHLHVDPRLLQRMQVRRRGRRPALGRIESRQALERGKGLATAKLAPGKSATMTVNLRSGAYMLTVSDPVGLGMAATHWLQVIPRTVVHGGTGVVQATPESPSPVCGGLMP